MHVVVFLFFDHSLGVKTFAWQDRSILPTLCQPCFQDSAHFESVAYFPFCSVLIDDFSRLALASATIVGGLEFMTLYNCYFSYKGLDLWYQVVKETFYIGKRHILAIN